MGKQNSRESDAQALAFSAAQLGCTDFLTALHRINSGWRGLLRLSDLGNRPPRVAVAE